MSARTLTNWWMSGNVAHLESDEGSCITDGKIRRQGHAARPDDDVMREACSEYGPISEWSFVRMKVDYIRGRSEHKAQDLLFCRNAYVAPHSDMRALRGRARLVAVAIVLVCPPAQRRSDRQPQPGWQAGRRSVLTVRVHIESRRLVGR
jgi:hypothetical protein